MHTQVFDYQAGADQIAAPDISPTAKDNAHFQQHHQFISNCA